MSALIKKIIETDGFNALIKGRYGYYLYNKNDIYVGRAIDKYGEFSEGEAKLFKQICKPGFIVVEIGANIGTHTVLLSQLVGPYGRVLAFEPQRVVFQNLCANIALNSLQNVECYQKAVGAQSGHVLIPDIKYDQEGNFGGVEVNKFEQGQAIDLVTLDQFYEYPKLDFLKVDVEGMEKEVIDGASALIKKHQPIIYIENDRKDKSQALIETIRSFDYKLYWHGPPLFNPDNFAGDSENIYGDIISLNMFCLHSSLKADMTGFNEVTDSSAFPLDPK